MIKVMDRTTFPPRFAADRGGAPARPTPGAAGRREPRARPRIHPLAVARRLLTCVAVAAAPAQAFGQLVDRGTLALYIDGEEVGREEFTIQRVGTGDAQVTLATGSISLRDGRIVKTILRLVGTTMAFSEYEAASVSGADTLAVRVVRAGDRLRTRTVAPWGEEAWEYPARASTAILDDGVAHHYFLLAALLDAHSPATTIHSVAPLADMDELSGTPDVGPETIEVGGERVATTRIRLFAEGDVRTAWFDGSGRLVRVAVAASGFEALRLR